VQRRWLQQQGRPSGPRRSASPNVSSRLLLPSPLGELGGDGAHGATVSFGLISVFLFRDRQCFTIGMKDRREFPFCRFDRPVVVKTPSAWRQLSGVELVVSDYWDRSRTWTRSFRADCWTEW
jgi:hypothetical protein